MDLTPYKNCLAHTNSIYISNENDPHKPCCWFKTGISASTKSEYDEKLKQLDIETNCSHCIKQEQGGATWSHRKLFQNPKEFVLGVCFDNICNLKCVTCNPMHSSQLIKEWEELNLYGPVYGSKHYVRLGKQAPSKIEFIKDVLVNTDFEILKLEIFGGEPLINPLVFNFLDWITEQPFASEVWLSITTNTTTYSEKIKKYCEKFKQVSIQLSMDGINETFEYLRYGAKWEDTVKVVDSYYSLRRQHLNFSLSFNYTMSWMNCMHFPEFYNWAITTYPDIHLHLTKLEGPEGYQVNILSLEQRKKIVEMSLAKLVAQPHTEPFRKFLDLYQQSMLGTYFVEFDKRLFIHGINLLKNKDSVRTMDYTKVLEPILQFIKNDTITES